jgi:hypothetical protein
LFETKSDYQTVMLGIVGGGQKSVPEVNHAALIRHGAERGDVFGRASRISSATVGGKR